MAAPLRDQIANVTPLLETLRLRREERVRQFSDIRSQIETIRSELSDSQQVTISGSTVNDEQDFSVRRLNEYQAELKSLQKEKVLRYFCFVQVFEICMWNVPRSGNFCCFSIGLCVHLLPAYYPTCASDFLMLKFPFLHCGFIYLLITCEYPMINFFFA
jgi:hypothetical protein